MAQQLLIYTTLTLQKRRGWISPVSSFYFYASATAGAFLNKP